MESEETVKEVFCEPKLSNSCTASRKEGKRLNRQERQIALGQ